ncbi:batten's disease protein Cln3 [Triangularia verruculosa]|uniref:Protein BTN n=1 Tax=Triangularia verruculosa TaxID=2587418 RepID=A0AAN7ASW1_9PEZI|nr:batten's disease protein Cln3 [Triangularia verruculosa]
MNSRSPSSSGLLPLPLPGTPSSSWRIYRARLSALLRDPNTSALVAFWLFGLINNILYVLLLTAAQDLVGPSVPKALVLLADVMPSFLTKLVAPYFIHLVPYSIRILVLVALSSGGMLLVALTPTTQSVGVKMVGVMIASLSSGGGELSFLGLTHYYGVNSLAAWGSGTGAAGLVGAGLYVLMTDWLGMSVRNSLLVSALMPGIMLLSFFVILPRERIKQSNGTSGYEPLPGLDRDDSAEGEREIDASAASAALLSEPGPSSVTAYHSNSAAAKSTSFWTNLGRAKSLFWPYMLPLLLVYVAEYTINQGVAPTLLYPLEQSPFSEYRSFYPFYGFLYQLGVFISRSSTPWIRIHHLYFPSLLQVGNLVLLTLHALLNFIPSVYLIFLVIFWEGLLGGAVYVNTFTEIMDNVPAEDREFSLGATSVSDSGGICIAGFIGMAMEVWLCDWQVQHGRDYCRRVEVS